MTRLRTGHKGTDPYWPFLSSARNVWIVCPAAAEALMLAESDAAVCVWRGVWQQPSGTY